RLAEPAGDAFVLLHEGDLVVVGDRLVLRVDHADAFEGADVDAELATGAELLDHFRFRDVLRLHPGDEVAMLVLNRVHGTIDATDGAVDAALGVNVVLAARLAPDRVGGALDLADAATNALVGNEMRHGGSVYLNDRCVLVDVQRRDAARAPEEN